MIKPERLRPGDTVAIVSLSKGALGESWGIHKLKIAQERLERDFKLKVKVMPNALKSFDYLYAHPEARAKDLMDAFNDRKVKAIICAVGGFDTIRLLPYINFETIKNNPKIFTGFSDSTTNHFMMYKAGLRSFYGANIMNNFAEYVEINPYTLDAIKTTLFEPRKNYEILPAPVASYQEDIVWWSEENQNTPRKFYKDEHGYEVLQGKGKVKGRLLGGCLDIMVQLLGTPIWPKVSEWKNKIMFIECCDRCMPTYLLADILRNLQAQGIFNVINGIIFGKPTSLTVYEEYKKTLKDFFANEANLPNLPIIYNVNFGHAEPIGVIPYGCMCELDCENKKITLLEPATK